MIGPRQSESPRLAERDLDHASGQGSPQPERQSPAEQPLAAFIDRFAVEKLGQVVIPAPCAMHRQGGMLGRFDGDIASRVAGADHEHSPPGEHVRGFEVARMDRLASPLAGIFRAERVPVMAIGDHHAVEPVGSAIGQRDMPRGVVAGIRGEIAGRATRFVARFATGPTRGFAAGFDARDLRMELNRFAQMEALGIGS